MGAKEKALALHAQGFNCAQCVLSALGDYTGMDEKTALAISAGFGGGVRCGEICGAVSGAVMALGNIEYICHLKNGAYEAPEPDVAAVVAASHDNL